MSANGSWLSEHAFKQLALQRRLRQITTAPHYPQSKGLLERNDEITMCQWESCGLKL